MQHGQAQLVPGPGVDLTSLVNTHTGALLNHGPKSTFFYNKENLGIKYQGKDMDVFMRGDMPLLFVANPSSPEVYS